MEWMASYRTIGGIGKVSEWPCGQGKYQSGTHAINPHPRRRALNSRDKSSGQSGLRDPRGTRTRVKEANREGKWEGK